MLNIIAVSTVLVINVGAPITFTPEVGGVYKVERIVCDTLATRIAQITTAQGPHVKGANFAFSTVENGLIAGQGWFPGDTLGVISSEKPLIIEAVHTAGATVVFTVYLRRVK